jgi:hypothetical protein
MHWQSATSTLNEDLITNLPVCLPQWEKGEIEKSPYKEQLNAAEVQRIKGAKKLNVG